MRSRYEVNDKFKDSKGNVWEGISVRVNDLEPSRRWWGYRSNDYNVVTLYDYEHKKQITAYEWEIESEDGLMWRRVHGNVFQASR